MAEFRVPQKYDIYWSFEYLSTHQRRMYHDIAKPLPCYAQDISFRIAVFIYLLPNYEKSMYHHLLTLNYDCCWHQQTSYAHAGKQITQLQKSFIFIIAFQVLFRLPALWSCWRYCRPRTGLQLKWFWARKRVYHTRCTDVITLCCTRTHKAYCKLIHWGTNKGKLLTKVWKDNVRAYCHHSTNTYKRVQLQLDSFRNSALYRCKWSVWRSDNFTPIDSAYSGPTRRSPGPVWMKRRREF